MHMHSTLVQGGSEGDAKVCTKDDPAVVGASQPTVKGRESLHVESAGSSTDLSPFSSNTVAGFGLLPAPSASAGQAGALLPGAGRPPSRRVDRPIRCLRSASRNQARGCASLDGLPTQKQPPRTAYAATSDVATAEAQAKGVGEAEARAAPLPRALTPVPTRAGAPPQYSLHGMPPPLPGCVWGLPMLPPPVPGLMGPPMIMPVSGMMAGAAMGPAVNGWGSCMPAPVPAAPARALKGSKFAPPLVPCPTAAALPKANGCSNSLCTWSHDATSTETGLRDAPWADLEELPFEEEQDEDDDAGMFHHISADLLHEDDMDVIVEDHEGSGQRDKPAMKELIADNLAEKLSAEALEWMDDELMLGAPLDKDACLDILA
jgi:hypothetical protein